jgi:uncharacterized protein involved in exopolysaccharide biosynthesis
MGRLMDTLTRGSEMPEGNHPTEHFGTYDILDLSRLIRDRYLTIGVYVCILVIVALAHGLFADRYYRSQAILTPAVDDSTSSGSQALLGSLGSLSSVFGDPGQRQLSQTIAILESRSFTLDFLMASDALPLLLPDYWDSNKQDWKPMKPGIMSSIRDKLGISIPVRNPETYRHDEAFRRFSRLRSVNSDGTAQLITLSIDWKDPEIAADWVNTMVTLLNEHARQRKIRESTMNIQYLRAEIEKATIVSARTALYSLLEREHRASMIANVRREFALQVIDPAVPADRPYRPKPVLNLFFAALGGVIIGILHLLLSVYLRHLAEVKETAG